MSFSVCFFFFGSWWKKVCFKVFKSISYTLLRYKSHFFLFFSPVFHLLFFFSFSLLFFIIYLNFSKREKRSKYYPINKSNEIAGDWAGQRKRRQLLPITFFFLFETLISWEGEYEKSFRGKNLGRLAGRRNTGWVASVFLPGVNLCNARVFVAVCLKECLLK